MLVVFCLWVCVCEFVCRCEIELERLAEVGRVAVVLPSQRLLALTRSRVHPAFPLDCPCHARGRARSSGKNGCLGRELGLVGGRAALSAVGGGRVVGTAAGRGGAENTLSRRILSSRGLMRSAYAVRVSEAGTS